MSVDLLRREAIAKPEDREEWLRARAPYVGASDAAALFGEHPFKSAGDLAAEKLGLYAGTDSDSEAKRRGRILEEPVAQWCAEDLGLVLVEPAEIYVVDETIAATLDRRVVDRPGAVEVKTTAEYVGAPKRSWWWQAQAQLLAVPLEWVVIACLDASLSLQSWTIRPDPDAQAELLTRAHVFLNAVRAGEMPSPAFLSYAIAQEIHAHAVEGMRVELDEEALRILRGLRVLQARLKSLRADEGFLKGTLGRKLGEGTEGVHDGRTLVTWNPVTTRTVDVKALRRDHPDIADEYATETTSRRMLLK